MEFWGASLRTEEFSTAPLDSWSISVASTGPNWLDDWTLNPAFPGEPWDILKKKNENLHDNGEGKKKNTSSWVDVYLLISKKKWWFSILPAMLGKTAGRRWLVLPLPRLSFQLLCDSRPFSESPLLSAWGKAHDSWAPWVGWFFLGWGLGKAWKKPNIPKTQCMASLPTF